MALKCDNCMNEAQYTHSEPWASDANFCRNCLPPNLYERAQLGHFPVKDPDAISVKNKSRKAKEEEEEVVVEEEVLVETPVDEDN